jgi:DNA replication licensing factor MCM5
MKSADRVAIHEAMEQQTISVAKAGITTRLNSRTSILAAANPIFGKFDEFKMVEEQIELKTTILSRFDCIFIVRDINNPETNDRIASHILDMHQGKSTKVNESAIDPKILKKYIKYAKNKVQPRLSQKASDNLTSQYVADRQKAAEQAQLKKSTNSVPITVRQLEAVIRLSESLARMKLKSQVDL